jgi:hypothetical protein
MKTFVSGTVLSFLVLSTYSCTPVETRDKAAASAQKAKVEQVAREYFATFAEREDWEKLLSFYRYDMQFEDIMLQIKIFNKEDFKSFYNWPEGDFQKAPPDAPHLVLQTLAVNDSAAVGRGYFNPFYYNGELNEWKWGSEFTIWLFFDEQLKIKRQIDFIEYPDWILEDVIARYRGRG